jgi:hypothetical protein
LAGDFKNTSISCRNPFKMDTQAVNYDLDTEDEMAEQQGEDLNDDNKMSEDEESDLEEAEEMK